MVVLFLDNSPERMAQIRLGLESGELKAAERGAHSLKSSSANVGALEVSRIAEKIEILAETGAAEEASQLHAPLEEAYQRACQELGDFLEGASA